LTLKRRLRIEILGQRKIRFTGSTERVSGLDQIVDADVFVFGALTASGHDSNDQQRQQCEQMFHSVMVAGEQEFLQRL
jgi:hypothetical protein